MDKDSKIYVAGSSGMVGSAIVNKLKLHGYKNIFTSNSSDLDLTQQKETENFFSNNDFEYVFNCAARVGGILENSLKKAQFLYDNLQIQNNLIHSSYKNNVKKFLFLGSSCIYPREADTPINEEQLLSGKLEKTNDAYAIAKIAGIKLCDSYRQQYGFDAISLMPTNLYGKNDNFNLERSHVIPALIRKFYEAKVNGDATVECWGTGMPKREFLYVDDLADACIYMMHNYSDYGHLNIGTGNEISIYDIAYKIKEMLQYNGKIIWDKSKPDGTISKVLNVKKAAKIGWVYRIALDDGLKETIEWYKKNKA